jgi:tetratricopeptide (TPR) repeat protein
VQHPDLDKAWADYDAAVAKAAERIKAAISKQFDAATAKGDLDPAEKWQLALEKFEKAGEVPADTEARAAVNAAVADYNKAKDKLFEAYEDVVKSLTMEKKIAEAKAARNEKATLGKVLEAFIGVAAGRRTPKSSKMNEATRRQKILAAFIGSWINDGNRDHQLIRADGQYIVNGNPANEWSGTWTLDMEDPEGPCIVRVANNRTKTRFYLHPENPNILMFSDGLMRRQ